MTQLQHPIAMKTRHRFPIMLLLAMLFTTAAGAQSTDITQMTDAVYVENQVVQPGSQVTLSVQVKNTTIGVRGFQFDLYLPEGITVAIDEDGFPLVELSTKRTTSRKMNFFDAAIQDDGALRVLANSSSAHTLDGTSGEACAITLNVSADATAGNHDLSFRNVVFTDPDAVRYPIGDTTATLSIGGQGSLWGDLNNDGQVTVVDVLMLVSHIMGQ